MKALKYIIIAIILISCKKVSNKPTSTTPTRVTTPPEVYTYHVDILINKEIVPADSMASAASIKIYFNDSIIFNDIVIKDKYSLVIKTGDTLHVVYDPGFKKFFWIQTIPDAGSGSTLIIQHQTLNLLADLKYTFTGGPLPIIDTSYKSRNIYDSHEMVIKN